MKLVEAIASCVALLVSGHEDEETGEVNPVEETKLTFDFKPHGDFDIIIRRTKE